MANSNIAKEWSDKAEEDFLFAKTTFDEGIDFYSPICFHLHQAVEKYLKAYIVANNLDFSKIHDLSQLLQICSNHDSSFSQLTGQVNELNPYYIETRYPGIAVSFGRVQTEQALKITEEIISFIKSKLR